MNALKSDRGHIHHGATSSTVEITVAKKNQDPFHKPRIIANDLLQPRKWRMSPAKRPSAVRSSASAK